MPPCGPGFGRAAGAEGLIACLLKNEPASYSSWSRLSPVEGRSRSESESEEGAWPREGPRSRRVDPKPSELPLASVKAR